MKFKTFSLFTKIWAVWAAKNRLRMQAVFMRAVGRQASLFSLMVMALFLLAALFLCSRPLTVA